LARLYRQKNENFLGKTDGIKCGAMENILENTLGTKKPQKKIQGRGRRRGHKKMIPS
jgi:hypothetical protein